MVRRYRKTNMKFFLPPVLMDILQNNKKQIVVLKFVEHCKIIFPILYSIVMTQKTRKTFPF